MATRSTIAIKLKSGSIQAIYSHFDGYHSFRSSDGQVVAGVGKILEDHYNTTEKVDALIKKGNVSSLGNTLGETKFYNDSPKEYTSVKSWERAHKTNFGANYAYLWDVEKEEWEMYTIVY